MESLLTLLALQPRDLSRNELTGPIPPAIGQLFSLTALYVVVLTVPEAYHFLVHRDLAHNNLTGPIPSNLGILASLTLNLWYAFVNSRIRALQQFQSHNLTQVNCKVARVMKRIVWYNNIIVLFVDTNVLNRIARRMWLRSACVGCAHAPHPQQRQKQRCPQIRQ